MKTIKKAKQDATNIIDSLKSLSVPIDSIVASSKNARTHNERNLATIETSLSRFGQRQPIVARKGTREVIVGNGRLEAARRLGWKSIAVVFVEDTDTEADQYALADNRSGELAEWDSTVLSEILNSLEQEDIVLSDIGFAEEDISRLLEGFSQEEEAKERVKVDSSAKLSDKLIYQIIVACNDEEHQRLLYTRLSEEGVRCKVSIM